VPVCAPIPFVRDPIVTQPCLDCGACCATYRVSFYFGETDDHSQGTVPQHVTIPISPYLVAMRGTENTPVRCVALAGDVGQTVSCGIYAQRSTTCREFDAYSEACQRARQHHGLPPLPGL